MAKVFLLATEAFSHLDNNRDLPAGVMDEQSRYDWKKSAAWSRVMCKWLSKLMASRYFSVPPKEFMFISRKFIGAYTSLWPWLMRNQCPQNDSKVYLSPNFYFFDQSCYIDLNDCCPLDAIVI